MRSREFFVANLVLLGLFLFAGIVTFGILTNQSVKSLLNNSLNPLTKTVASVPTPTTATTCSQKTPLALANPSAEPHVTKLSQYQAACHSFVTDKLMVFIGFPSSPTDADAMSTDLVPQLKLFSANHLSPIIIAEPYVGNGLMSYRDFINGKYKPALAQLFSDLKAAGVTDEMMGTWVPFPESNTPSWNNKDTEPADFATVVNMYLGAMKAVFPQAKGSVLLSATTYDPNDLNWENGDYLSFIPYIQNIDKGLVDSFGIQGFPWVSNATIARKQEIFRASEFLQPDLAISAAQELHTRDIWINTGSFATKYTQDPSQTVSVSLNDRKAILSGIIDTAKEIQNYQLNEYRVSINLFAQDKSKDDEATDWSYFQDENNTTLLREFMQSAEAADIPVSLFDMDEEK